MDGETKAKEVTAPLTLEQVRDRIAELAGTPWCPPTIDGIAWMMPQKWDYEVTGGMGGPVRARCQSGDWLLTRRAPTEYEARARLLLGVLEIERSAK